MAPLLSLNRSRSDLTLHATEPDGEPTVALEPTTGPLPVGWPIVASVMGLVAALVGWVLCAGLSALAWVGAEPTVSSGRLGDALGVGTQLWLLANGAGAHLGRLQVTLVPWGATALFAFVLARCTAFAARASRLPAPERAGRARAGIPMLATVSYLVAVGVASVLLGGPVLTSRALAVLAVLAGAAAWAAARALGHRPSERWPGWARRLPQAVVGAQLVLLTSGAALLVVGLVTHFGRVSGLTTALQAGVAGDIVLLFAQLAFAPNAMVWAASYALGAGFGLGDGSVVAPAASQVGLLPGLPLLGAVPGPGPGVSSQLLWLAAGVLAGVVSAWLALRSSAGVRVDQACLTGCVSGLLAALALVGLAWATGGDLGGARLAGLGPRLTELAVMAASTLGLSGLAAGLVLALRTGAEATVVDTPAE